MIKKIILTIILYTVTLYLIIISNIAYMFLGDLMKTYIGILLVFVVGVIILFLYILYLLIRGIYKKEINKEYGYSYLGFFIVLFIFYYGYYIQYDKGENIPDSIFETKLQNVEVKEEDNGLILLGKFVEENSTNNSKIYYLDKNINKTYQCIIPNWKGNKQECEEDSLINSLKIYEEDSDYINELNNKLLTIVDKQYFKEEIGDIFTKLQGLSALSRINLFTSIYYIEKGETKKVIDNLLLYKRFGDKMLEGDIAIIGMIVGITIESNIQNNVNYILDNYTLNTKELNLLKKEFTKKYNVDQLFGNVIKMEYLFNKYGLDKGYEEGFMKNSILFNREEFQSEKKRATLDILNGNDNYFDKYKKSYLKRVYIYRIMSGLSGNMKFNNYKKDLKNLNIKNKKLLEKINKKLEN